MGPLETLQWLLSWGGVAVAFLVVLAVIGSVAYAIVGAVTDAVDGRKERDDGQHSA